MPDRRLSAQTVIAREPEVVFDWVADYHNLPSVLAEVSRWEPLGDRTRGTGARFDVALRAFGLPVETVLVLDQWDEPRSLGWRSESGPIDQTGRWRFRPRAEGTETSLAITYRLSGLAALAAAPVEGLARGRLEEALERMRELLEEGPAH